jgi:hypothetical protein
VSGGTVVLDMAGVAGADLGAKMNNCASALPATGGTCKGDNLNGAQTLSTAVTTAKAVVYTFSGQAISQSAAVSLAASNSGIDACRGASPTFTKAGNIDQITMSGAGSFVRCLTLVGVGGSFTGNGIIDNAGSSEVALNTVSGEAAQAIKSGSATAVIRGNAVSGGTAGNPVMSGNGSFVYNTVTANGAGDGIDLGNAALAEGNQIGISLGLAVSGLCGINANIDQIGDRTKNNQIQINDSHNGDVNYGV